VNHHVVLKRGGRAPLFAAAMAAALLSCSYAFADVPPNGVLSGRKAMVDKLVSDAEKAIQSGNIRLAFINLKNAVTADPGNAPLRVRLGIILIQVGDEPSAERELRQARKDGAPVAMVLPPLFQAMLARGETTQLLEQFPDPGAGSKDPMAADILKARALALQALKRPTEAIDAMDRSLALKRDGHGLLVRGRLALMQGQPADAMKYADEAVAKATSPDPMLFKIGMLLSNNNYAGALDLSNQLLARYPGNLQGRLARVEAYVNLKRDAEAKTEIDDILAKYPNAYMGTYYRALLMARSGNAKGAWNLVQNLPGEFRDGQPRVAILIAQMAVAAGNDETAASILNRILLKTPSIGAARERLAAIRLKQNNPAAALEVLEPIKDSQIPAVLELLSNAYVGLHRNAEALDTLKRLDATGKGSPQVKRSIALLEVQTGNVDQGIKDLTQLASKEPANPALAGPLIAALTRARHYPEALAAADRLGADPKQRATALIYRATVLMAQQNTAGAQAAYDKAVSTDPQSVTALFARAQFFAATQRPAEASRDFKAVLAIDGKNLAALLQLAEIAAQQGQDQNARELLGQAIAAAPQNALPRTVLIRYLMSRRDYKNALAAANDLVKAQPKSTDGVAMLGEVQYALGQKKESIATFRRLAVMAPTSASPQILLGNALAGAGDRAGATRALDAAVKLDPASAQVRGAQIGLLFNQGNADAAVAAARAFQAAKPGPEADIVLADTLVRAKQRDQAEAVLTKSLSERPGNAVLLRLVRLANDAKDTKRANELLGGWVAKHPDDMVVRMEYGTSLMQQEDNAAATVQYQAVLKQLPNNVVVLNNLGWLLQKSDPKRALSLLNLAYRIAPSSSDVADTLGWLKVQQKDAAGGLELLNRAHALQPKNGSITYHLVVALDANGKRDTARGLLQALLASNVAFKERPAAQQLASSWH